MTQASIENSLLLQVTEQLSALSQQIGNLEGQSNIIISEQHHAAVGRKETHDRLRGLEQSTAHNTSAVERITPLVDAHEKTYQRGIGAAWLWRVVWGLVAGSAGAVFALLASHFGLVVHP